MVSSCGRQVTPNRGTGTGIPSGFLQVKYRVAQAFDFVNYRYLVVFNTTGNGVTPLTNGQANNYSGYSFAIVLGGATTGVAPVPQFVQYFRQSNTNLPPTILPIVYSGTQVVFTQNSNGSGTEFTVLFDRGLANGYASTSPTASPSPSASPSASPSPTPSPTPSPSASPSASPSTSPTPLSTVNPTWLFNFFTTDPNNIPTDALGTGGANDSSFQSPVLDTTTPFDITVYVPAGATAASSPAAQLSGGELASTP